MHKLCDFIYDELKDLEKKVDQDKLTMDDVEYGDLLAHFLKSLKTVEAMDEGGYSNRMYPTYSYYDGSYRDESYRDGGYNDGSYARGRRNARRDSRGRYSREYSRADAMEDMRGMAEDMMEMAPDDATRQKIQRFMSEMGR